jgi:cytochrome b561
VSDRPTLDHPEPHYSTAAIWLHWVIAALILFMTALGYYMLTVPTNTPQRAFTLNLHKSMGLLTFAVVAVRLFWRAGHPPPALPDMPIWQVRAAWLSHRVLFELILDEQMSVFLS